MKRRFLLLFVELLVAAIIAGLSYDLSTSTKSTPIVGALLASVSASFVFLFIIDAARFGSDYFDRRAFRKFFGDMADNAKATLVYPDFELSDPAQEPLVPIPAAPASLYRKHSNTYAGSRFIDVPQIVASNDLFAMIIIATRLGHLLGDSPNILTDGQAVDSRYLSLVSFGLTSNSVTQLYMNSDPEPLFSIEDPETEPKLIIHTADEEEQRFGRSNNTQHGLILRYRPNPETLPQQTWFICAGLAAAGTPAAAWALAHNWPKYHKRFGSDDFAIIFRTSDDVHAFTHVVEVACKRRRAL